jgi:hypothetical protein
MFTVLKHKFKARKHKFKARKHKIPNLETTFYKQAVLFRRAKRQSRAICVFVNLNTGICR